MGDDDNGNKLPSNEETSGEVDDAMQNVVNNVNAAVQQNDAQPADLTGVYIFLGLLAVFTVLGTVAICNGMRRRDEAVAFYRCPRRLNTSRAYSSRAYPRRSSSVGEAARVVCGVPRQVSKAPSLDVISERSNSSASLDDIVVVHRDAEEDKPVDPVEGEEGQPEANAERCGERGRLGSLGVLFELVEEEEAEELGTVGGEENVEQRSSEEERRQGRREQGDESEEDNDGDQEHTSLDEEMQRKTLL